jgi:hypothetical protein
MSFMGFVRRVQVEKITLANGAIGFGQTSRVYRPDRMFLGLPGLLLAN